MTQMKKTKTKTGEISGKKELNEIKASKLPNTEFKTMVVRMPKELRTSTA